MNYVRNTWYVAGWAQDFAVDKPVGITLLGEPVVIWRGADNVLTAGVWQCDAGTLKLSDLPIHEVCVLIEGEVVITSDDGRSESYKAGEAFILHKGFSGTWHMPVATKKYSIVYCG